MMTMGRRTIPRVLARTLTKVAFEVREGELRLAREKFDLSTSGINLLAKPSAYTVLVAHPDELVSVVVAKPKASALLLPHVRGDTIVAKSADRLKMSPGAGDSKRLAIPIAGSRAARAEATGKVRKAWTPAQLYEKYGMYTNKEHVRWKKTGGRSGASTGKSDKGRLFISKIGNVYLRAKRSGGDLIRLYRLRGQGKLRARFTFVDRATRVARAAVTDKFRYVLDKEIRKSSSR